MSAKALEAAAAAYYEVRPLHSVLRSGGQETPVPWSKLVSDKDDPVRANTVQRHRAAIKAAVEAYLKMTSS